MPPEIHDGYGFRPTDPYYPYDELTEGTILSFEHPCSMQKQEYVEQLGKIMGFGLLPTCSAIRVNEAGDIIARQTSISGGTIMFRVAASGDIYASHFCPPKRSFLNISYGCTTVLNSILPGPLDPKNVKKAREMLMMTKEDRKAQEAAVLLVIELTLTGIQLLVSTLSNSNKSQE